MNKNKTPPHSIEAEQAILGSLMLNNDHWDTVIEQINTDDFYSRHHQLIFAEMQQLITQKQPIDLITLTDSLESKNKLNAVGGFAYLAELSKNTPSAANVAGYTYCVNNHKRYRQLLTLSHELKQHVTRNKPIEEVIENVEQQLFMLAQNFQRTPAPNIADSFNQFLLNLENRCNMNGAITGTPSGFIELDEKTCGFQNGDLILLAGRPSMGKTALGLNFCTAALTLRSAPVQIYSLEMITDQLLMRLVAMIGEIPLQHLRSGQIDDDDLAKLSKAAEVITSWKDRLLIDDSSDMTPALLRSRVRRNCRKFGKPALILVDYLQLMRCPNQENRTQEITEISRALKALAKEINTPIIALSQLNRSLETRPDKRPNNGDLRDSGALEQDADVILFVYRDEVYHNNSEQVGMAEIIFGKQRQGPIGTVKVRYQAAITRFDDMGVIL